MSAKDKNKNQEIDSVRVAKIKQRERVVRKGRMKQEKLRTFIRLLLTGGILAGIYFVYISPQWFLPPNAFNVNDPDTIKIINNKIVPTAKITNILNHNETPRTPIYIMNLSDIKKQIMQLDPIDKVYIRRYAFPARLQIIVREKVPAVSISPDIEAEPVAFITQDGVLIGRDYLPFKSDNKTILVLSFGNKGDDYRLWDEKKINQIQKIVKYVETFSGEEVEYLDFRNPDDVFVKIKTVNIRLGHIDDKVYDRIKRIPSVLPEVNLVGSKVKYLDLSWEKVNYLKLKD